VCDGMAKELGVARAAAMRKVASRPGRHDARAIIRIAS
jgi:hypothetical protein